MIAKLILSALLLYLSFPNFIDAQGFGVLAWIALMPLFLALDGERFRKRLAVGLVFGLIFFSLITQWLADYSKPGYILFVLSLTFQTVFFAAFFQTSFKSKILELLYIPSCWVAAEITHQFLMGGFSWTIGYSQAFNLYTLQWASLFGSHGISFALVLVNFSLYKMMRDYKLKNFYLVTAIAVPSIIYAFGYLSMIIINNQTLLSPPLRIHLVQANIDSSDRLNPSVVRRIIDQHIGLSKESLKESKADLIIWPETAVTDDFLIKTYLRKKITGFAKESNTHLLTGVALFRSSRDYNSAALIDKNGNLVGVYDKMKLVPFSEHTPKNKIIHTVSEFFVKRDFDFQAGKKPGMFSLPKQNQRFGVSICSEDFYPSIFRKMKEQKAGFGVVLLNDGWFKRDEALMLHTQASIMRAAENRLPIVRAANTGLTGSIDMLGRMDKSKTLKPNTSAVAKVKVQPFPDNSLFSKFGEIFAILCFSFVIIMFMLETTYPEIMNPYKLPKAKKTVNILIAALAFSLMAQPAYAGGAAAQKNQMQGQQMQMKQQQMQQQQMIQQRMQQQQQMQQQREEQMRASQNIDPAEVKDEVDINDLWKSLETSSKAWPLIIDFDAKEATVAQYINVYRQNGIGIAKPASHYVQMIDNMSQESPSMLEQPFSTILRVVAIIEYDFSNGQDKDSLAYQILGKEGLIENRKRLGLPVN